MPNHQAFPIACPNRECRQEMPEALSWIKSNSRFTCPECKAQVTFRKSQFLADLRAIDHFDLLLR